MEKDKNEFDKKGRTESERYSERKENVEKKEQIELSRSKEKASHMSWAGVILIQLIIVAILAVIFLPYKIVTSSEVVPYTAIEEYYASEPYLVTTKIKVNVPVEYSKCDYQTPYYYIDSSTKIEGNKTAVSCSILNLASMPTDFIYYIYGTDSSGKEKNPTTEKKITVDSNDVFETTELMTTASAYGCHVQPQINVECINLINFTKTTKDELSVKSKQVVRVKTVVKSKTNTYFKVVNWLFDSQLPWQNSWTLYGNETNYYPVKA